jgi:hypothetical protein
MRLTGDPKVTFNGKTYGLWSRTGKVLDTNTRAETEVHGGGGGGGGFSYQGTGGSRTAPVQITSTTTRYTKIFLLDTDGKEHALELVDFDVRCRAGNGLTVIYAIPEGKDEGPFVAAYNHSTRELEVNTSYVAKLCEPKLIAAGAGAAIGLAAGIVLHFEVASLFTCAFGLWLGGVVGRRIGRQRALAFTSGSVLASVRSHFEAIPSAAFAQLNAA